MVSARREPCPGRGARTAGLLNDASHLIRERTLRSIGIDIGPFEGEITDTALTVVTVLAGALGLWGRITATSLITR